MKTNIKIDRMGIVRKNDLVQRVDSRNVMFFNRPGIVIVLNPYSIIYNKIHRFRKMDKSKIYWKLCIYMIKTLYPEADNWISAEMKNLNEIFGYGEDRKSSMLKIKENLLYLKKNIDRIANDFYTQVNQMLSDRSALKNNKYALNVVFSKSIDIAFQEVARMEAANERGIENIQTSIRKFRN